MTNCMLDIETLGTSTNAVIVSIGAVRFNKSGLKEEFYSVCYKQQPTREMDLNCVKWWMNQSDQARDVFNNKEQKVITLKEALVDLKDFITREDGVWANGTLFDFGILEHAYESEKIYSPWTYGKVRCLRSIRAIYPEEYEKTMEKFRTKASHNALDDAKCQALALISLSNSHGFTL